jgi:hypothetical protein
MKQVVYKYPLNFLGEHTLKLPVGAIILCISVQHGTLQLWALVDKEEERTEERLIATYPTGQPFAEEAVYIDTFYLNDKALVFHAFEIFRN